MVTVWLDDLSQVDQEKLKEYDNINVRLISEGRWGDRLIAYKFSIYKFHVRQSPMRLS